MNMNSEVLGAYRKGLYQETITAVLWILGALVLAIMLSAFSGMAWEPVFWSGLVLLALLGTRYWVTTTRIVSGWFGTNEYDVRELHAFVEKASQKYLKNLKVGDSVTLCFPHVHGAEPYRVSAIVDSLSDVEIVCRYQADVPRTGKYKITNGRSVHDEDPDFGWIQIQL